MKTFGTLTYLPPDHDENEGPRWQIEAEPAVMMRVKRVLPRVSPKRTGAVTVTATEEIAREMTWLMERFPLEMSEDDRLRLIIFAELHQETENAAFEILNGTRTIALPHEVPEARDYQIQAADVALTTGRLLLTDELGLGKTLSGLLIFRDPDSLPGLVVTQTHLTKQWLKELGRWLPWLRGHIIRDGPVYNPAHRRDMHGYDPDVLITSYSKLAKWAPVLAGNARAVVWDEAQELRHPRSAKYKAAGQIADAADRNMGETATPVYNYGGEVYNIIDILAKGVLGSRSEFSTEWGLDLPNGGIRIKDPSALGSYLVDQGLMLRRTRKDVGRELPDVIRVTHEIDSDPEIMEQLTSEASDLARILLSSSATYNERRDASKALDTEIRHATGVAKAAFVADFTRMLLESGEQVLLLGWHHDVYDIWMDRLAEFKPARYTGKQSTNQKEEQRQRFIDGEARVMLMSLRSGAGLNGLQDVSKVVVFGELDWSPMVHEQCIGRLNRDNDDGSLPDEPVVTYYLVSDAGSDPAMADLLEVKRQQGEGIRDPLADLVAPVADNSDRIRKLAKTFLERKDHESGVPA